MNSNCLDELELPRILALTATLAVSEPGAERVLRLTPSSHAGEVAERLEATGEMVCFLEKEGRFEFSGLTALDEPLAILARDGAALTLAELREVFGVAGCILRLRRRLSALPAAEGDTPSAWPVLRGRAVLFPDFSDFERLRAKLLDADGGLRDDASDELARIRRALAGRREDIARKALSILRSDPSLFQDATVVQRGDRTCLPVKAEHKGRIPGILHERSQTGATFFVEPLAIVEMNNELASLRDEETEEIARILREATAFIAARRSEIIDGQEAAILLDLLQALGLFARRTEGVRPRIANQDGSRRIELRRARHPLLDERLAPLRRRAFGEEEERGKRRVVPVDVEFDPTTRVLVLTGPNAGGKTATLKIIGLSAAMAQCGLFIPADEGSTLPVFDRIITHVGDAQDLLADLSSFSSYMARLGEMLPSVGPASLVLLDELGSATDPDEGGALAVAILEQVAAAGGIAVVTTHLGFVKSYAAQNSGFAVAAMEFDTSSGTPTFRVLPGVTGRSFALSLAERAGMSDEVLQRARSLLGEGWVARERAEAALERARTELEAEKLAAAAARREREEEREQLASERKSLVEASRRDRLSFRREMDRLKRVVDEVLARGIAELKERIPELAGASQKSLDREANRLRAGILSEARAAAVAVESGLPSHSLVRPSLKVGDRVRLEGVGSVGILRSIGGSKGRSASIEVSGKTMHVEISSLVGVESSSEVSGTPRSGHASYQGSRAEDSVPAEINLIGKNVEESIDLLDDYLDRALLAGRPEVRVIHGYGTGKLRAGVTEYLRKHRAVVSTRPGESNEGGGGATVVKLDA